MASYPLLSFIVLSYNYENYIGRALRSILDQTVQDFEIVIVDDASTDGSRELIAAIDDPRIRLLVNERNRGGAESYNRAVSAARGDWLVNLDADDWIAPEKSQQQLDMLRKHPELDIIGTYCYVVNAKGERHADSDLLAPYIAHDRDLNSIDAWVGHNLLCRSSTMIRRATHLQIGLDDPTMIRAPDYELWTRAVRDGCRFGMVTEFLTYYRLHARGVTFGDPRGTFLELSYAMLKNFVPKTEDEAKWPSFSRILAWIADNPQLSLLRPIERYNLLGAAVLRPELGNYQTFVSELTNKCASTDVGKRILALHRANPIHERLERLNSDIALFIEARDWWQAEYNRLSSSARPSSAKSTQLTKYLRFLKNRWTEQR